MIKWHNDIFGIADDVNILQKIFYTVYIFQFLTNTLIVNTELCKFPKVWDVEWDTIDEF